MNSATTFLTPEEAALELELPLLGVVPRPDSSATAICAHFPAGERARREYHRVADRILLSPLSRSGAVGFAGDASSPLRAAVVAQLAATLAAEKTSILIDADLRGAHLSFDERSRAQEGLVDVLRYGVRSPRVVAPTQAPGLNLLPVGSGTIDYEGTYHSEAIPTLFAELRRSGDLLLVNGPAWEDLAHAGRFLRSIGAWILVHDMASSRADNTRSLVGLVSRESCLGILVIAATAEGAEPAVAVPPEPPSARTPEYDAAEEPPRQPIAQDSPPEPAELEIVRDTAPSWVPPSEPIEAFQPSEPIEQIEPAASDESLAPAPFAPVDAFAPVEPAPVERVETPGSQAPISSERIHEPPASPVEAMIEEAVDASAPSSPSSTVRTRPSRVERRESAARHGSARAVWIGVSILAVAILGAVWFTTRDRVPEMAGVRPTERTAPADVPSERVTTLANDLPADEPSDEPSGQPVETTTDAPLDAPLDAPDDAAGLPAGEGAGTEQPVAEESVVEESVAGESAVEEPRIDVPAPEEPPPPPRATARPAAAPGGTYAVHVSSVKSESGANQESAVLAAAGWPAFVRAVDLPDKGRWYRVYVGPYADREAARGAEAQVRASGQHEYTQVQRVPRDGAVTGDRENR